MWGPRRRQTGDWTTATKLRLGAVVIIVSVVLVGAALVLLSSGGGHHHIQQNVPTITLNATGTDDHILLTWSGVPSDSEFGFTHYNIYRSVDGGDRELVTSVDIELSTYEDHSIVPCQKYYYEIEAYTPIEKFYSIASDYYIWVWSPFSIASLGTSAAEPPTGLTVHPMDGRTWLTFSWPSRDGGHEIERFTVYRGTAPDALLPYRNVSASDIYGEKGCFDENATNGQTYYYAVSCDNGIAESNLSAMVGATPCPAPSIRLTQINENNYPSLYELNWSLALDGRPVRGFKVWIGKEYPPFESGKLVQSLPWNESSPQVINVTQPLLAYYWAYVQMSIEYEDGNVSFSEPVSIAFGPSMDGPMVTWYDYALPILLVAVLILVAVLLLRSRARRI